MTRAGWFDALLERTALVRRFPGYAGVLARMDPIATNTVPIAAVALRRWDDPGSRIQLLVNLHHFSRHPDDVAGILLHEIQHVLLGHLTEPKFHAVRHPRIMEIAMEISADEPLAGLVPPNGFEVEAFAGFGIAPEQSTLERYRLLAAAFEGGALCLQDYWSARMRDTHRPGRGGARGAGLGDLLDARSDGATERNWNRARGWLGAPSSEAQLEAMKLEIAKHLRGDRGGDDDPQHDRVRIPKQLQRVVFETGDGPRLDWRRVLREAFPRRRIVRHDYLRPNRRFPHRVGEIPGRTRRPPKPTLHVAIDTSGSMTGDALERVAREVGRLAAHARLTIVECDAAVHRVYPLAAALGPFVGGGDTDFAPAFDEATGRELEGVVYFTDGRGAMPALPPALPVLWALTHGDPFLADWGAIVRLPAE
jgi:predicted metal-dependent peptidase